LSSPLLAVPGRCSNPGFLFLAWLVFPFFVPPGIGFFPLFPRGPSDILSPLLFSLLQHKALKIWTRSEPLLGQDPPPWTYYFEYLFPRFGLLRNVQRRKIPSFFVLRSTRFVFAQQSTTDPFLPQELEDVLFPKSFSFFQKSFPH